MKLVALATTLLLSPTPGFAKDDCTSGLTAQVVQTSSVMVQVERQEKAVRYYRTGRGWAVLSRYYGFSREDIGRFAGLTVVDLGCGFGRFVIDLRGAGANAIGIDLALAPDLRGRPGFIEADATRTGLPSSSADYVFSSFSVFFYENHDTQLIGQVFTEVSRLLKSGGRVRITPLRSNQEFEELSAAARRAGLLAPPPVSIDYAEFVKP